ncbi:hypothetical protein BDE36_0422 [Arcticibacter tournemirensis]|uniref:Uncharacterized protein n=1 Tax=Arcticibacter tournemirensis TaxID=699437 RepID=A0A5M9HJD6_9SPHI|nr:hypothetical protein [Arcticibacter tournemirensis]KAA8485554.1 hypothetical protein F1649_03475 [Arcticibacter tournemirensis]TQM48732.1 hypothetical protein BDE36_0422 [Arcticibacter tournemirensis]
MEKEEFKELSPKEIKDLQYGLRHLFVNYPYDELKKIIWELYRGWVYNSAESVTGEEITNMLLFYEGFNLFLDDLYEYCEYLNRTVLKKDDEDK